MHKGLITMMGRIMPGSKAVLSHNEFGEAIWCDYYPPDIHLKHIIPFYCSEIVQTIGKSVFVIDREVNSVEIARMFVENKWELICLLDANQYQGIDSFSKRYAGKLEDGTILYKASWKLYHEDDPRTFLIAKKEDKTIVYWATPKIAKQLTAKEIILSYRKRSDVQENSIKHMIEHGSLNTNFGIKTQLTPNRTLQRKVDKIDAKVEKLKTKSKKILEDIEQQEDKISQSILKKHNKRLEQRYNKRLQLEQKKSSVESQINELDVSKDRLNEPLQRYDRDFRKQQIMTFRTLFLENILKLFFSIISVSLSEQISIKTFIELFFYRPGFMVENDSEVIYWLELDGLSCKYKNILHSLAMGFNSISLSSGKKNVLVKILGVT